MSLLSDDSVNVAQASKLQTGKLETPLLIQPHIYISTTTYSVAANGGGAIGTVYLPLSVPVPIRSIYVGIIGEHVIQVTSGGAATIALDLVDANPAVMVNAIVPALAFNAAGGLFTGAANTVSFNSPAPGNGVLFKQTSAANYLRFTIAGAALTAGSMIFAVQYVL